MYIEIETNNERYCLSDNEHFEIEEISGLTPPTAVISSSPIANQNGEKITSTRLNKRNIVITLNLREPLFESRTLLYRIFPSGKKLKVYVREKDLGLYTNGYVESIEFTQWSQRQEPVISILCPNPFLIEAAATVVDTINSSTLLFYEGVETGGIFTAQFNYDSESLTIRNNTYGQVFTLNYSFQSGDIITVNTNEGEKSVSLKRNNTSINIMSSVEYGSEWISIKPGNNSLRTDNSSVSLKFYRKFLGV